MRHIVRSARALGQVLAQLRYERGLTQEELAETLGVNRRYLSEIETGKDSLFALRLFEILRELQVHVEIVPDGDRSQRSPTQLSGAAGAADPGEVPDTSRSCP